MKLRGCLAIGLIVSLSMTASMVLASSCVDCHTDAAKLKELAKTIPKKEASAETAGKG